MKWKQLFTPTKSLDASGLRAFIEGNSEGSYTLLDVRQHSEYEASHIPGSLLIPLPELTDRIHELDPGKPTIVYWAVGGRSRVAAQMLSGNGFEKVYNLNGGIKAWQGLTAVGPAEAGMALLTGKETPAEIIVMALGLEEGLRAFYDDMARRADSPAISDLFGRLAAIEVRHKAKLLELHAIRAATEARPEAIDQKRMTDAMEGGLTAEEFLKLNQPAMQTNQDVVAMAMTIEAQALDLYMRQARKLDDLTSRNILQGLADDEKAHLSALGKLMDDI